MDKKFESPYLPISELDNNQADLPLLVEINDNAKIDLKHIDFYMGNWYQRKTVNLIEVVVRDAIVFYKTLANSQKAEEFGKKFSFLAKKFTFKQKKRENAWNKIPTIFFDKQLAKKSLIYKKKVDNMHIPVEKLLK